MKGKERRGIMKQKNKLLNRNKHRIDNEYEEKRGEREEINEKQRKAVCLLFFSTFLFFYFSFIFFSFLLYSFLLYSFLFISFLFFSCPSFLFFISFLLYYSDNCNIALHRQESDDRVEVLERMYLEICRYLSCGYVLHYSLIVCVVRGQAR